VYTLVLWEGPQGRGRGFSLITGDTTGICQTLIAMGATIVSPPSPPQDEDEAFRMACGFMGVKAWPRPISVQ